MSIKYLSLAFLSAVLMLSLAVPAEARRHWPTPVGVWYVALDAEPYVQVPGLSLPGLVMINREGTALLEDGGDFGGFPFQRDSAQFAAWRFKNGRVLMRTLFLQADAISGDVQSWWQVKLKLRMQGANTMQGTVAVSTLECLGPAPIGALNCPDPIAAAEDFVPQPEGEVRVTLRRLSTY